MGHLSRFLSFLGPHFLWLILNLKNQNKFMYPILGIESLQSLQSRSFGSHFLIMVLKS